MFFQDKQGGFHPISRIVGMTRSYKYRGSDEIHSAKVYLQDSHVDGASTGIAVDDATIDGIIDQTRSTVAAQPGFFMLEFGDWGDDEDPFIGRHAVLGWRVAEDGGAQPVIFDNQALPMNGLCGLLNPDGTVQTIVGATYDNEAAWIADMKAEVERRRSATSEPPSA